MRQELPCLALPAVACGLAAVRARAALRLAIQRTGRGLPAPLQLSELAPPDSGWARAALERAESAYGPHLLGHAYRSQAWAKAVARHLDLPFDPEVLFVGSMLCNLGLTDRYPGPEPFELRGAREAHHIFLPDTSRANAAYDAVAQHTSIRAASGPAEVRLVQSGWGGDLVALDAELVHPLTQKAIRDRWPKTAGFRRAMVNLLRREARKHRQSPCASLMKAGFGGWVLSFPA